MTFNGYVSTWTDQVGNKLTSLSQSLKAEMRVKTVGLFTSLQVREETKLVTPWTYHLLSGPKQFRGPPESPWDKEKEHGLKRRTCFMLRQHILLAQRFCFFGGFSHTLHPEMMSPPAHIMVLFTTEPHQSLRVHMLCSTTGSKACCSLSGIGPWAARCDRASLYQYIKAESSIKLHKKPILLLTYCLIRPLHYSTLHTCLHLNHPLILDMNKTPAVINAKAGWQSRTLL